MVLKQAVYGHAVFTVAGKDTLNLFEGTMQGMRCHKVIPFTLFGG